MGAKRAFCVIRARVGRVHLTRGHTSGNAAGGANYSCGTLIMGLEVLNNTNTATAGNTSYSPDYTQRSLW